MTVDIVFPINNYVLLIKVSPVEMTITDLNVQHIVHKKQQAPIVYSMPTHFYLRPFPMSLRHGFHFFNTASCSVVSFHILLLFLFLFYFISSFFDFISMVLDCSTDSMDSTLFYSLWLTREWYIMLLLPFSFRSLCLQFIFILWHIYFNIIIKYKI